MAGLSKKTKLYWFCQIAGWTFYILVNFIFFGFHRQTESRELLVYFLMLPSGIALTHFYREFILRTGVLRMAPLRQLAFMLVAGLAKGFVFFGAVLLYSRLCGIVTTDLSMVFIMESALNFTSIFWLWNVLYFGFQYFQNYRLSEINALKYLAASRQSELHSLKAQLNPHFIFNCLNSIRNLIGEDPGKAKSAVTTLSSILRTTLVTDKQGEIMLREELSLINDYLLLEKMRFEERLEFDIDVPESLFEHAIPPFMVQTLVENAIKHGLARQPGRCRIVVKAGIEDGYFTIAVTNSGKLRSTQPLTGIGLKNTAQRLSLLYGPQAGLEVTEGEETVCAKIIIPVQRQSANPAVLNEQIMHESNHR